MKKVGKFSALLLVMYHSFLPVTVAMKGGDDSIIIIGGGGMGGGGGGGPIIMEGGGKKDKKDGNTIIILPQQQQKQSSYMSSMPMMHPAPQMMPDYAPPSMGYDVGVGMKMKVSKPKQRKSSKKKKKKSKNSKKQASDSQFAYAMPLDYNAQPRSQVLVPSQFMPSRQGYQQQGSFLPSQQGYQQQGSFLPSQQGYQQQASFMNFVPPIAASSMGHQMEAFDPSMMYGQMNGYQQQQNAYGNQMMMLSKMMKIPQIVIKVPAPIVNVPTPIVNVPAAVVNVSAPIVNVPETRVTVPAPIIEIPPSVVNVPTPIVNVPQPNVNVQVPNISVPPAVVNVPKNLIIQKQLKVIDKPKQVEYGNREEIEFDEDPPKRYYKSPSDSRRYTYPPHVYTDYERSHDPYHRYEQPPPSPPTTSTTTTTTPAPPNIQYVIPVSSQGFSPTPVSFSVGSQPSPETHFSPTPVSFSVGSQPSPQTHFQFSDQILDGGNGLKENHFGLSDSEIMDFMVQNNYQPLPTPPTRFVSSGIHSSRNQRPEILVDDRHSPNIVFEKQNQNRHHTQSQIVFDDPFPTVSSYMTKKPTNIPSFKKVQTPIRFEGLSNEPSFTSGSSSRDLMLYQDQTDAPVYVPRPKISHKFNDKFDESDAGEDMAETQEEPYSWLDEKEDSDDKRDEERKYEAEKGDEGRKYDEEESAEVEAREMRVGRKRSETKKVANRRRIKSISFFFPSSLSRVLQATN